MENKRKITRREFLQVTALATAGSALAACNTTTPTAAPPTVPPTEAATEAPDAPAEPTATEAAPPSTSAYIDSPMLASLVENGTLPPIEERLPENPMVFPMKEMVGKHGGVMRRGFKGPGDKWGISKINDRSLVWWDNNLVMRPRMAESWEVNEDGSEWTFYLRKGIKWSDGVEYTTQDIRWWFDNHVTNAVLFPATESRWFTGSDEAGDKTIATLETPDDYTFSLKYAHPKPLLVLTLGREGIGLPSHHMKQWNPDTCDDPDALQAAVEEAGFDSWDRYYMDDRRWWFNNPDLPSLGPWLPKNDLSEQLFIMERNPYFFGVDEEGKQLPYIDAVHHRLFESNETFNLWIANGEIDFQARHVSVGDYTLLKESEDAGDYSVVVGVAARHQVFVPNQCTQNLPLREFFQNRDVRIAMSLAINRDEINELVYSGLCTPRQYSPLSVSPQYYEKLSNAYIEYAPDKANQLLDDAGYTEKDNEGFRKYPDGEVISFTIEGTDAQGSPEEDAIQQIIKMFQAVGIKCEYKAVERSLFEEHYNANDIEASWWFADRTVVPLAADALIFRGAASDRPFADAYYKGLSDPDNPIAIEPPEDHYIRKLWNIWEEISQQGDPDKQNELFQQMLDVWAEELPMIGVVGEMPSLCVVKNRFRNFVAGFPNDDTTGDENVYNTETYFWENPEEHISE